MLPWVALAGAAPCWLTLAGAGLGESLEQPTFSALWSAGGPGWALLAATALLLLPIAARRDDQGVALVCLAAAASMGVATICLPVVDEGLTAVIVTALAVMRGRRRSRHQHLPRLAGRSRSCPPASRRCLCSPPG